MVQNLHLFEVERGKVLDTYEVLGKDLALEDGDLKLNGESLLADEFFADEALRLLLVAEFFLGGDAFDFPGFVFFSEKDHFVVFEVEVDGLDLGAETEVAEVE